MGGFRRRSGAGVAACLLLVGCSGAGDGAEDAAVSSGASPLAGMSVEESAKVRAAAAREAQIDLKQCLEDNGFPSTWLPDGSLRTKVIPEQRDDFSAVGEQCHEEVDVGLAAAPLTDAEVRWLYEGNVAAYECLRAEGYDPPAPNSFEVFARESRSDDTPPWSPFLVEGRKGGLPQTVCKEPHLTDFDTEPWPSN